jgi:uncharacterized membrane protein YcjF (UPF0283 family)
VFRQLSIRLRRLSGRPAAGAPPTPADAPEPPFKPRGRTHYADATTTVIGRTLTSPNGTFRIADLSSFRPIPQVEPRERAKDAVWMSVFTAGLLIITGAVAFVVYQLMASKFGGAAGAAILGTTVVTLVIFAAYVSVVAARWREVYDRDPERYRHVIVAVHRGESVAITPDLPYETADKIVTVLHKIKGKIPKAEDRSRVRTEAAA